MNDFTKEELETLHKFSIRGSDRFNPNDSDPLCLKIQSMIDNYCEHEWRCWDDQYNTRECIKCYLKRQGEIHGNE